jgi:hypothetical protein
MDDVALRVLTIVAIVLILIVIVFGVLFFIQLPNTTKSILRSESGEVRDFIQDSLQLAIQTASKYNVPLPDLYNGCSGSTINKLRFCGNLKMSDSYNVGGNQVCEVPKQACRAGCAIGCTACKIIPFVSCRGPCNDCYNGCQTVYDKCAGALKVTWSVNVLEVSHLADTMHVDQLESFALRFDAKTNQYKIPMRIHLTVSPLANVDIRVTTGLANYQGDVSLGTLQVILPLELYYDCQTKRVGLQQLEKLTVSGVSLGFASVASLSAIVIKSIINSTVKSKLDTAVQNAIASKLNEFFETFMRSEFVPKLQLNITCPQI